MNLLCHTPPNSPFCSTRDFRKNVMDKSTFRSRMRLHLASWPWNRRRVICWAVPFPVILDSSIELTEATGWRRQGTAFWFLFWSIAQYKANENSAPSTRTRSIQWLYVLHFSCRSVASSRTPRQIVNLSEETKLCFLATALYLYQRDCSDYSWHVDGNRRFVILWFLPFIVKFLSPRTSKLWPSRNRVEHLYDTDIHPMALSFFRDLRVCWNSCTSAMGT